MSTTQEESPVYSLKISSVGPGYISGQDAVQELSGLDLAMKLHYIRSVYYFPSPAFEGYTILNIKETMFYWLSHAYVPCGRLRRSDDLGRRRPYIKCNDCGARFIDGQCKLTLDEWLEKKDDEKHKLLVSDQVIGPDLGFSPLVLMQITKFKCGGTAVGMSWAHVLGDAFSASEFINLWGKSIAGQYPTRPLNKTQFHIESNTSNSPIEDPLSVKRVSPVGDHWATSNSSKMETFSFHIPMSGLTRLQSVICGVKNSHQITPFESICTIIWKCMAKIKDGSGPNVVTVCKNASKKSSIITNESQIISVVKADLPVIESSPMELGLLIMNQAVDERSKIEKAMQIREDDDDELPDFLVYGANLTFVDLTDSLFYELNIKGQKPVYVNCMIDNIGDEGLVLVLPAPKDGVIGKSDFPDGRVISITLPKNQVPELKSMLNRDWSIIA